jgi:hypothetical protein
MHKDESIYSKDSLLSKPKDNSMHKGKSIWGIAIRSSIITSLGLMALPLLLLRRVQRVINLKDILLCCLPFGTWIAGIYFAQRSYKATYQHMTYGQGVKIGFWTSFFAALWTSLLFSGVIAWYGKELIPTLTLYGSLWFVLILLAVFMAALMIVTLIGTLISVILSWFSKTKNRELDRQQVVG